MGIYVFDRLARLLKTRYTTARITALSELGMTRVEVLGANAGWRAGQHVRVRVLEGELGGPSRLGMLECHPFTICSVSESPSGENLTLMCKKTGAWTNKLFELARGMEYGSFSSDGSRAEKGSEPRDVRLLIEGPYGGPNHTIYSSFSGALVVAGGSGITYALGVVQDLLQKDRDGRSRLKCIELVWSVQDPCKFRCSTPNDDQELIRYLQLPSSPSCITFPSSSPSPTQSCTTHRCRSPCPTRGASPTLRLMSCKSCSISQRGSV